MKHLFLAVLVTLTFQYSWARTITVTGRATESGYCSGSNSICFSQLKDRATRSAQRDTQWNCDIQRGRSLTYTLSCSTMCNPSFIPPNVPNVFVSCRAECRMSCEIKD